MSIKSSALFAVGDEVQIKHGASAWMKAHNYWINDWPESIDGMVGTILHDYTRYAGNDCHYEVSIEGVNGCGVHPQWLTANMPEQARAGSSSLGSAGSADIGGQDNG